MFKVSEPYRDRRAQFLTVREEHGWRLKMYAIQYGDRELDEETYELGLRMALDELPEESLSGDRPGVGFVIFHQGRGDHYLVLNWWGLENELFNRVYVREFDTSAEWRKAVDRGVACVWDMQIFWHERQAYVRHILSRPDDPSVDGYLDDVFENAGYQTVTDGAGVS